MVCPVKAEYQDDDYQYILFEFNMNYTPEGVRNGYHEIKKKEKENASDDLLMELGYTDSDILNKHDIN